MPYNELAETCTSHRPRAVLYNGLLSSHLPEEIHDTCKDDE